MRVLLADDDSISRTLITRFLNVWGYEVISVATGDDAWNVLQQDDAPNLAILDCTMPGINGSDICRRVRDSKVGPYRYLLLLTFRQDREDLLRGLESGADDFITKPVDAAALKARLQIGRRILELQDRLMQAVEVTRFEASHDALTGLWNRAAVLQFLHGQFARSTRDGISVAVAIADVDHFKKVNDTHGHLAGDEVLREVAKRIRKPLRSYDWVGRYGGKEFLIIAPDCTLSNAFSMCERLRSSITGKPFTINRTRIEVTLSFGIATTAESGAPDEEGLLRAADRALYLAKEHGRNRIEAAKRTSRSRSAPLSPSTAEKRTELVQ
ncbi:MAG TPA: diguanylate cyclase [Terriglobales bacterium]|nr:diguanylate cyclase [Terriglobales bacterium]